jgi:aminotransferase
MIRIFQPTLGEGELAAIAEVFADQWPGAGPRVKDFKRVFADYVGVEVDELIAVTSCTEGLFQSVAALEPTQSSEIILPTISFIGAAHAVSASGAALRLVDVDPVTLNPRLEHIEQALTPRTRAILLLHFGGRLDGIEAIADLARRRNIVLIEDAACALGGKHKGVSYGTFGDIGVWSFDSMKLLVTGDGGMIRIHDSVLREKIYHRVHLGGVRPGLDGLLSSKEQWWEVNPHCWGRMAYMNDLTASIGLVQIRRLASFIERRREIAKIYDNAFSSIPWIRLPLPAIEGGIPYFYWIQTPPGVRDILAGYLRERGIYTTFRYWPLHRTVLYGDSGFYPGADLASEATLLLPIHQNLSENEVAHIVESIATFVP